MTMWTVLPPQEYEQPNETSQQLTKVISYCGTSLLVESDLDNTRKIIQILSTNPDDFLNAALQPGNII